MRKCELIFALDKPRRRDFIYWIDATKDLISFYKVGLVGFTSLGKDAITLLKKRKKKVFLDLKFFDIPNTMIGASLNAINWGVDMLDFHLAQDKHSLAETLDGIKKSVRKTKKNMPAILGVTVLTSETTSSTIQSYVLNLARKAKEVGFDGVVTSGKEAKGVRKKLGKKFIIVTPGIRLKRSLDDQRRAVTPKDVKGTSDFIVVGRPIYESKKFRKVIDEIRIDLEG